MIAPWSDDTYNGTLRASNALTAAAVELNDRLGAGGGATSPETVLRILRQIINMAKSMAATLDPTGETSR
jgi:hypothetical protein